MKKHLSVIFVIIILFTLASCTAKTEAPMMKAAAAADTMISNESSAQEPYINEELGFSFNIPDSWERENYTPEVTDKVMEEDGLKVKYKAVAFVFQGDKENPLLTIDIVPKTWWDIASKKAGDTLPDFLGTKGDSVYCYTLPQACPYDVGTKADLYNSMVLLRDDVPNHFKILGSDSSEPVISNSK